GRPDPRPLRRRASGRHGPRRGRSVRGAARRARPGRARVGAGRGTCSCGAEQCVSPRPDCLPSGGCVMARGLRDLLTRAGETQLTSVPDGMTGEALADLAGAAPANLIAFVARDGRRLAEVERAIRFFAPKIEVIDFPAWDCLPYDRVSPHPASVARRMAALSR